MSRIVWQCYKSISNEVGHVPVLFVLLSLLGFLLPSPVKAAGEAPQELVLDGQLYRTGTADAISEANVNLTIQILDSASCLLYEESQNGLDLNSTKGYFNIRVGSSVGNSKRTASDPGNSMAKIFQNTTDIAGASCLHNHSDGSDRYLKITVDVPGKFQDSLPVIAIGSTPSALVAESLQGYNPNDFVRYHAGSPSALVDLDSVTKGLLIPRMTTAQRNAIATPAAGLQIYNISTNQFNYYNGTSWQALGTAGSGISSLGGQTGNAQSFANDTNVTITSNSDTHTLGWTGQLSLARGGTNANLSAVNGGAVYSTGTALGITAAGSSGQVLTSNGAAAPTWATVNDSTKVIKAGDTMTGLLVLSADPSAALGSATKQYVDSAVSTAGGSYILKNGSVAFTADQSMGSHKLTNVTDPAAAQDAATKNYVDTNLVGKAIDPSMGTLVTNAAGDGKVLTWDQTNNRWTAVSPASGGISALTGDVTASGSGSVAATVASVGGSTAANVNTATVAVNTNATAASTASVLVKRDASGISNFKGLKLDGATSGTLTQTVPATVTNYSVTWPSAVAGTANSVLASDTSGNLSWVNLGTVAGTINLTSQVTGVLPIANGGTNSGTALTNNQLMYSNSGAIKELGAMTDGQIVVGKNASAPQIVSMSGDVTIDNTGATTVGKIGGTTVSGVGLANNNVLQNTSGGAIAGNSMLVSNGTGTGVTALTTPASGVLTSSGFVPTWSSISSDTFTQYALLAGRSGGQTLNGGTAASENLTIDSTAHATKGNIILAPSGGNVGIGTTSPDGKFEVADSSAAIPFRGIISTNYGTKSGTLILRKANGTAAAPTAITSGQAIGTIKSHGYGATGWSTVENLGSIEFNASENWTDSAQGTSLFFRTVANGTTTGSERMRIDSSGNVGIGTTAPTAKLHLPAGTAAANTAPLKLTAGTNLTTPEDGAMEFDGTNFYLTSGGTRRTIASGGSAGVVDGLTTINNTGGSITMNPSAGNSVIINQTTASTSSTSGALVVNGGAGIAGAVNVAGSVTTNSSLATAASTAATGVSNQNSPSIYLSANYWTGAASAVDQWSITNILGTGSNPTSTLTFDHPSGSSGTKSYAFLNGNVGIGTTAPGATLEVATTLSSSSGTDYGVKITPTISQSGTAGYNAFYLNATESTTGSGTRYLANFAVGGTSKFTVSNAGDGYFAGNIGIGTTAPSNALLIQKTATSTGSDTRIVQSDVTANPSGAIGSWVSHIAMEGKVNTSGTNTNNLEITSLSAESNHWGTSNLSQAEGVNSIVANKSTGTINSAYGAITTLNNSSTGTVQNAFGVLTQMSTNTGTITNAYGVYIKSVLGTNKFGFYEEATAPNYFAGNVGIGGTAPSAALMVNSAGSVAGTISSSGSTVTGSSTTFTTTFKVGDSIVSSGQIRTITAIASDTSLTTASAFSPVIAGGSKYEKVLMDVQSAGTTAFNITNASVLLPSSGAVSDGVTPCEQTGAITRDSNGDVYVCK